MKKEKTNRGFSLVKFQDRYNAKCSIQKSNLATERCIWFGVDDADPKIKASKTPEGGNGWVSYEIPKYVFLTTKMHLTRKMVIKILPTLIRFVLTGNI